ncbi:MAG TPA: hypothetical protein ENJ31_09435 [Anaerolineae bacterium]|nr:hypothetical protein [Anaerolineae bacterium]
MNPTDRKRARRETTGFILITLLIGFLAALLLGACGSQEQKYLALQAQAQAEARAADARIAEANSRAAQAQAAAQAAQSEAERARWAAERDRWQAELADAQAQREKALAWAQVEVSKQEKYNIAAANQPALTAYLLLGLGGAIAFLLIVVVIKLANDRATSNDNWRRQQETRHAQLLETLVLASATGAVRPDLAASAARGYLGQGQQPGGYLPAEPQNPGGPPMGYLPPGPVGPGHRRGGRPPGHGPAPWHKETRIIGQDPDAWNEWE